MALDTTHKTHDTLDECRVRDKCTEMVPIEKELISYWRALIESDLILQEARTERLPLFLRRRYLFRASKLFGTNYHLAIENAPQDPCSPAEYADHLRVLQEAVGGPVALVLPSIPSYARGRMLRMGIPFIVPGSQVFLPPQIVDLRERQPVLLRRTRTKKLTPAAQCLVLYHLQREPLTGKPLQEIAHLIGYSPIMVTMVKGQLEAAGICTSVKEGRTITLRFVHDRKELWEQVAPLLSAPDRIRHWVTWPHPGPTALLSGMTALSRLTMIGDDPLPTYALWGRTFRASMEKGEFHGCRGSDEANACVESWSYDPRTLASGETVDILSLYLSLRDSPDERVRQQLETLIQEFPW